MLLKKIAGSIEKNYPDVEMIILLVDERPEEVTDMKRSLKGNGEVIYSTFDEMPQHHVKMCIRDSNYTDSLCGFGVENM